MLHQPGSAAPTASGPFRTAVSGAAFAAVCLHVWSLYRDHAPPTLRWFPHLDKVEHLVGFGLPCFLVLLALHLHTTAAGRRPSARAVALVAGLFVVHAGVSEVVQGTASTTRSGDPYDALADVVGTLLGLLGYLAVRPRRGPAGEEGRRSGWGPRGRA